MFIKRECSRQSLLSWISMTLEPANCGAARCRAAPPRLWRRAAPIAFLRRLIPRRCGARQRPRSRPPSCVFGKRARGHLQLDLGEGGSGSRPIKGSSNSGAIWAFLQGPQNDRVQTGLNSEGATSPIPGLLLLSPALHQRATLATRQTTQFTKSTDCGSIAWFVTFTKVARGQSKVALRTLQPGMKTGALAGGVASVRVVRLRIWSMVCATYEARTMYSPVLCAWRSSNTRAPPGAQ